MSQDGNTSTTDSKRLADEIIGLDERCLEYILFLDRGIDRLVKRFSIGYWIHTVQGFCHHAGNKEEI